MRILHVTPYYRPRTGGAETHATEVCEHLVRRGHDVTVLSMMGAEESSEPSAEREMIGGVKVFRYTPADRTMAAYNRCLEMRGAHRLLGATIGAGFRQMLSIGPYSLLPFWAAMGRLDVVAVSNWYCASLPFQLCQARRFRRFALVGTPFFHTERPWATSPLYAGMLARCDAVVAMTEHEKAFVEERSGVRNAHVVGVGVDPDRFARADGAAVRARYGIGSAPVVGYVGRMAATKGIATLIAAMKIVWAREPGVRLLLAGAGSSSSSGTESVAAMVEGLSRDERRRVVTVGRFDEKEKASIFDAVDVFAMPSVAESFGIAYLEAWMCRKPVIGASIPSTTCVIDEGVDGMLVQPGDSDALARSILVLLSNRALRERLGDAGHTKTVERFTWRRIADRLEQIYEQASARVRVPAMAGAPADGTFARK